MAITNQKVNLSNCTHEQLSKAISKIQTKAAATFVRDDKRIGHHMKHMMDMAEHYVVTATDDFGMTREGHPGFRNWLPSEFGATKNYWEGSLEACLMLHTLALLLEIRFKSIRR